MQKEKNKKISDETNLTENTNDLNNNHILSTKEDEESKESDTAKPDENKINELENEISGLKDKLLRKAAEFENYKRRTENDQLNLIKYAAEPIIQNLLPIVDDFERSLLHIESAKDINAIKEGIKLVYEKLMKALKDQGVEKIESTGEPFNVDFHDALMQKKVDGVEPHTVVEEVEKGYKYKDKVIRHAKVIVSEASSEEAAD